MQFLLGLDLSLEPTILEQSEENFRETETPVREKLQKAKSRAEREILTGAEKTRCRQKYGH